MKILLTNNHLANLAGSETFTYTLAKELEKDHQVDVFTFHQGIVSKKLNMVREPQDDYDLLLINHNTCLNKFKTFKGFKILTCHGTIPGVEQPRPGADAYVSISKEVQEHLDKLGFKSTVIHNGIDCHRFKPQRKIGKLKTILSLAKSTEANQIISEACKLSGLSFLECRDRWDLENAINQAELVVSLGRGAMESMACGRAVVVFDARPYMVSCGEGIITKENIDLILEKDISGRATHQQFTPQQLAKEFLKYNPNMGIFNRKYALNNFNIKKQAKKYLNLYDHR